MTDTSAAHPTREAVVCALLQALLDDECGLITVEESTHDPVAGTATHALHVQEAPRDWFYEARALIDVLDEATDAITHTDEPAWVAYFTHPDTPAAAPFQQPEVLLFFDEPGDGITSVVAIGNVAEGWCLIAEASIGDYTDDDADACGALTLHLGPPSHINRVVADRASGAVECAWGLVETLIGHLPPSHQDAARQALAARVSALH